MPKKIRSAGLSKKPMLVLVAALFVAIGIAAVLQTRAASYWVEICNSSDSTSVRPITGYVKPWPTGSADNYRGECWSWSNSSGQARVWIPYVSGDSTSNENIKSYQIMPVGGSYGPCHDAPNQASNPPDVSKVYYKTFQRANCET